MTSEQKQEPSKKTDSMLKPEKALDMYDTIIKDIVMDIIIMSYARTPELREVTENALRTCELSKHLCGFNYIVIESESKSQCPPYEIKDANVVSTLYLEDAIAEGRMSEFNYNACANWGFENCRNTFTAICNNDLHFNYKWADKILKAMLKNNAISASPLSLTSSFTRAICPNVDGIEWGDKSNSYKVGSYLAGWCIVINRPTLLMKIGDKFDTDCSFWHADNVYKEQLTRAGIPHMLCLDSIVNHMESRTLFTMPPQKIQQLTHGQTDTFNAYVKRKSNENN